LEGTLVMMHPHTKLAVVHPHIGLGVVATRFIPRGTITWVRDPLDRHFSPDEIARLPALLRATVMRSVFIADDGVALFNWDHGRFVNHSCDPNCFATGYDFELAIRDVASGEELTDDYGRLRATADFDCLCGSPNCRGRVLWDGRDLLRFGDIWDSLAREAFPFIPTVEQPLAELLTPQALAVIARGADRVNNTSG
jgi:hypothetical protein